MSAICTLKQNSSLCRTLEIFSLLEGQQWAWWLPGATNDASLLQPSSQGVKELRPY